MSDIWKFFHRVYDSIPANMMPGLIKEKDENSNNQLSLTVVATSDKTLDFIWKTPTVWII